MATPEETKFLGIPKSQFPSAALRATSVTVIISLLAIAVSIMIGMRSDMNANDNAIRAEVIAFRAETNTNINALRSEMNANDNALRSEMNANDNALRAEINTLRADIKDLDDRVDALTVEMSGTNAQIESIERQIPDYNDIDARFNSIEREQNRLRQRMDALETLANPE